MVVESNSTTKIYFELFCEIEEYVFFGWIVVNIMLCSLRCTVIHLDGIPINRVCSVLGKDGDIDADVKARMACGWLKWRECSGVLCDKKMPLRLKGKIYRTVVRPALMYGSECWAPTRKHEQTMHTTEMRMLRWTCGVTRLDKIPNTETRRRLNVAPIIEKAQEHRLRWYGHIKRMPDNYVG